VLLFAESASAQVIWKGDFSTGDYSQFRDFMCGAYSGPGSCPGGLQPASKTQATPTAPGVVACSNPDLDGCRFQLVTPPRPAVGPYRPTGRHAMRVHTAQGFRNSATCDNASLGGKPWGESCRNELKVSKEPSQSGDTGFFTQGDSRYYGWSTYVPQDTDPHGTLLTPANKVDGGGGIILQFHSEGECDGGGPPLAVSIVRTDAGGYKSGSQYMLSLYKRDVYHQDGFDNGQYGYDVNQAGRDPVTGNVVLTSTGLPALSPSKRVLQPGNYRLWPWAGTTVPLEKGMWHTFVLRVHWSTCDNATIACATGQQPGVVELWVDGRKVYPDTTGANGSPADPAFRPTLYTWPAASEYTQGKQFHAVCPDRQNENSRYSAGAPIRVYMQYGFYGAANIPSGQTIYHADLVSGASFQDVDPRSRQARSALMSVLPLILE
jgi:hypothetical protein